MNATKNDVAFYGNLILSSTADKWYLSLLFLAIALYSLYKIIKE